MPILFNILVMNMSYTKPIKKKQNQNELITTPIKTTSVFLSEKFVLQENVFLVILPFLLHAAKNFQHMKSKFFITLRVYTSANCICCDLDFLNLYYVLFGLFRIKIRLKIKFSYGCLHCIDTHIGKQCPSHIEYYSQLLGLCLISYT